MNGHQLSNTRRMNRHYQSAGEEWKNEIVFSMTSYNGQASVYQFSNTQDIDIDYLKRAQIEFSTPEGIYPCISASRNSLVTQTYISVDYGVSNRFTLFSPLFLPAKPDVQEPIETLRFTGQYGIKYTPEVTDFLQTGIISATTNRVYTIINDDTFTARKINDYVGYGSRKRVHAFMCYAYRVNNEYVLIGRSADRGIVERAQRAKIILRWS